MMDETMEPGVFELVPPAVQPLVENGDFQLERIEFETWAFVRIFLTSPDVYIFFGFYAIEGGDEVRCSFYIKPVDKRVEAKSLFSVFDINISMDRDDDALSRERYDREGGYWGLKQRLMQKRHLPRKKESNLFENSGHIQELSRLSSEIKNHLPAIRSLLSLEHIEETYRLCSIETRKEWEKRRSEGRQRVLELRKKRNMVK